jgi:hypothetical protein
MQDPKAKSLFRISRNESQSVSHLKIIIVFYYVAFVILGTRNGLTYCQNHFDQHSASITHFLLSPKIEIYHLSDPITLTSSRYLC